MCVGGGRLRCKITIVILICASINQFIKQSNKSDVENESECGRNINEQC